ncbi:YcxB family protein [Shewanella sp. WXL01]|uniref:YcxB family protein n=1 Tax=Shewanella sp. WXL01 TaxID=2709721 RepID=UPI0014384E04|nr:YcxB family protein [Shewanella sp. WXL01]NKF49939.1 YcxB family protein [Shewanella sp. WXL01]
MSQAHFQARYTLDKAYFAECFDQTASIPTGKKPFYKAIGFAIAGLLLITVFASLASDELVQNTYYLGYFFIGLAVVEVFSIKFKRTWWLWRQMMSKAAGNPLTLTIDEQGIHSYSDFINHKLSWQQITSHTESEVGFTLQVDQQKQYLSKRELSEECIEFVREQLAKV